MGGDFVGAKIHRCALKRAVVINTGLSLPCSLW